MREDRKFWDMHGMLFRNQNALDSESLIAYASELRLDVKAWSRDMVSERTNSSTEGHAPWARLLQAQPSPDLASVAGQLGLGERQLERKFREWIGIGPKRFARLARFQHPHRGLMDST